MYDIQFDEDVRHSVDIQEELRTAIDRDGLVLAYQPIVDLASGDRVGVEALVRMRAPDGSLRMPDHFIPQAEATGLIVPLGWWVIGRALRDLAEAVPGGDSFVSINVSPVQLREEGLASRFLAAVSAAGLAPQRIVVEVTETALIRDSEHSRRALSELKHAGVRIALDDFGTGYSSLTWLTHFPVDIVKVDRSFTAEVGVDDRRTAVVTAMIAVSHELELTVVAEGVETEAQRALLVEMGCDRGQGYLFGRPELLS